MKKEFTKEYIISNSGCYSESKVRRLTRKGFLFTIHDILSANIPLRDKYWFVCISTGLTKDQNSKIAVDLAEIVLPLYEHKYPNNKSVREAIDSARLYVSGHISIDELSIKRIAAVAAAWDACSDADAYTAAYAAAYSCTAAYAAAAEYAAYTADDAYAAAEYAAATGIKNQIEKYLTDFVNSQS